MEKKIQYIAYYRVSTERQGASGLGLEAQRSAVATFAKGRGEIAAHYTEIESGKKNNRPQLAAAIAETKKRGAVLLIAKLDRLARSAGFIFTLRDAGVNFLACDMPDANGLTVGIFAALAQHEAETISARTRAALAEKKKQGAILGTPANLTSEARKKGRAAHTANATSNTNTKQARGYATMLASERKTLRTIAALLNSEGFKTARGGKYSAVQVARLIQK